MLNLHMLFPEAIICVECLGLLVLSSVVLTRFNKTSSADLVQRNLVSTRLVRSLGLAFRFSLPVVIETLKWFSEEALWYSETVWYGTLTVNFATQLVKLILVFRTSALIWGSEDITTMQGIRAPEYVMLMGFASLGLLFLASANDLISLYIALEWQSLVLYVLASFRRASAYSTEAGLKYFIQGSVMSAVYLLGASIIYGLNGTLNFNELYSRIASGSRIELGTQELSTAADMVNMAVWTLVEPTVFFGNLAGMMLVASARLFKMAAVPFHSWAPDVYEGSPTSSSIYFAVVPKIAQIALMVRLCSSFDETGVVWQTALMVISLRSMTLAPFSARVQMKWKRFLAYSSIANVGNMLLALSVGGFIGVQAIWFYVIIYGLSVLRTWLAMASLVKVEGSGLDYTVRPLKYIHELSSLAKHNVVMAYTIAAAILGSAGLPPFVMFQAKLSVVFAAVVQNHSVLAIYMVLISVLTTFYYLRFIKIMFFTTDETDTVVKSSLNPVTSLIISLLSLSMVVFMADSNRLVGATAWMTASSTSLQA